MRKFGNEIHVVVPNSRRKRGKKEEAGLKQWGNERGVSNLRFGEAGNAYLKNVRPTNGSDTYFACFLDTASISPLYGG